MLRKQTVSQLLVGVSVVLGSGRPVVSADAPPRPKAPSVVAVAENGSLFIADLVLPGIFRRGPTGVLEPFAPGRPEQRTPLRAVTAMAVGRDGTLFAADRGTGEVYRIEAGKPPVPLSNGGFEVPTGLAINPEGDLILCDLRLGIIARVPKEGGQPAILARVPAPRGLALAAEGEIVVLSMGPDQLVRINPRGEVRPIIKGKRFRFPLALSRDETQKHWLVSDGYAGIVWSVSDTGEEGAWIKGAPLMRPEGLALDPSGALLIADPGAGQVFRAATPAAIQPYLSTP